MDPLHVCLETNHIVLWDLDYVLHFPPLKIQRQSLGLVALVLAFQPQVQRLVRCQGCPLANYHQEVHSGD